MTAVELQADLAEELENITKHMCFKNKLGEETHIKAFEQSLPVLKNDDDFEPFPYIIVRMVEGDAPIDNELVKAVLIIGIYDNDEQAQGHKKILNIIQDIKERFQKNPILNKRFVFQEGIKWTLQEDDTYPYYFGGIETYWQIPQIQREVIYS